MADIVSDFLERAKSAKGDPQVQAALAAEFTLEVRPEPERAALHASLDAAALLHWFDTDLLERMLEISVQEARKGFEALKSLPFVERYRSGEDELYNVHEATRLGWRRQMARENQVGFRGLSLRAAACFAEDPTLIGQIEHVYHLLSGEPERGADELEVLDRKWTAAGTHPEDFYALAAVLGELEETALVQGRARAATILTIGWARDMRGETAQLADLANEALRLARESTDLRMESEAQCLLGGVLEAQGQLKAAEAAFGEYFTISRRLAEQDPSNAGWQRELALACRGLARAEARTSKNKAALKLFEESLRIFTDLVARAPGFVAWQEERKVIEAELKAFRKEPSWFSAIRERLGRLKIRF
jgi:tetratricopeptide (TPR) repeat protein